MWMTDLPPFMPFFLAALLALVTSGHVRSALMIATPLLGGLHLWLGIPADTLLSVSLLEFELTLIRADRLSLVFGYIFHIAAFVLVIYTLHLKDTMQHVAGLVYVGSAMGAVFAGDLMTLFIFWELLVISSVFLIFASRTARSSRAAMRCLVFQMTSGVLLLVGMLIHYRHTGSLAFDFIGITNTGGWLILLAFGIKCAFPLLHNWVTDAYPQSTPTGAAILSIFTTKVAVYALARGYPGTDLLIYIGAVMACFPVFYAAIENDLRRVLSYILINQLGFMVCAIGIGTALALNGVVAHAFSHIIYESLLFMTMGAVLYRVGHVYASDLGGLYKTMPKTALLCIIGAASISALPLFSGFVSKSFVMKALLEEGHTVVWLMLLFASAGVLYHAGIRLPYFAFFAHDSGIRTTEAPRNMIVAMAIMAALCILIGVQPQYLYALLPWDIDYWPYDTTHVLAQLQLVCFVALAFVWMEKRHYTPAAIRSLNIDAEWLYRKAAPAVIHGIYHFIGPIYGKLLLPVTMMGWVRLDSQSRGGWVTGRLLEILLVLVSVFIFSRLWLAG